MIYVYEYKSSGEILVDINEAKTMTIAMSLGTQYAFNEHISISGELGIRYAGKWQTLWLDKERYFNSMEFWGASISFIFYL